jgi:valine dehydrogenase (NAD+)
VIFDPSQEALDAAVAAHPDVKVAGSERELVSADVDVFSPNALGGALDGATVAALQATVVCGGANNQLAHPGVEQQLAARGITYAPDYVVNAGGVIQVADELHGFDADRAMARASAIFETTLEVLTRANADGVPPAQAADRLAEARMAAAHA